MIVVLDTNVVVSAFLSAKGPSARALIAAMTGAITLLLSPLLVREYRESLNDRSVSRRHGVPPATIERFLAFLAETGTVLEPEPLDEVPLLSDEDDFELLALARAGSADIIVTGDAAVRALNSFGSTLILTPREFVDLLERAL